MRLASVERAGQATDAEHAAAIASTRCIICGAAAGVECTYGALAGGVPEKFPGRAHTRRVRAYLGALEAGGA